MKFKILTLIFIIFLLVNVLLSPQIIADDQERSTSENPDSDRIIDKFFIWFFKWAHEGLLLPQIFFPPLATSWKAARFTEPPIFEAKPNNIDFEYLGKTSIEIGMPYPENESEGFRTDYEGQIVAENEFFEFSLDFPEGIDESAWTYNFNPQFLYPELDKEIKTVLTIESTQPDYELPPTNLVFTINVTQHLIYGNLYFPPKGEWLIQGGRFFTPTWIIGAITTWGKYSGTEEIISSEIDIMVRANRFHLAQIKTFETMSIKPDDVASVPVEIHNLGSHDDSFNFRVKSNGNSDLIISAPNSVTLEANEAKTVYISVASPRIFNDPGTIHNIDIEAYSLYDNTKIFSNTVTVVTEGIYVSERNMFYFLPVIISIVFIILLIYYKRKPLLEKFDKIKLKSKSKMQFSFKNINIKPVTKEKKKPKDKKKKIIQKKHKPQKNIELYKIQKDFKIKKESKRKTIRDKDQSQKERILKGIRKKQEKQQKKLSK